jgi:uncharacterized membrane protein YbjE (DUF340 family)
MVLDAKTEKAFEFASEVSKQVLALASGIIALTITFSKDFVAGVSPEARKILALAWVFYIVSILFGILTLMALTASLGPDNKGKEPSVYSRNVRIPAAVQVLSFFLGLCLTVAFGFAAINTMPTDGSRTLPGAKLDSALTPGR